MVEQGTALWVMRHDSTVANALSVCVVCLGGTGSHTRSRTLASHKRTRKSLHRGERRCRCLLWFGDRWVFLSLIAMMIGFARRLLYCPSVTNECRR